METTNNGQAVIRLNPYVTQINKLADSLGKLSHTFLQFENAKQTFTKDEIHEMFNQVEARICRKCENHSQCRGESNVQIYQMVYQILYAVEEYGNELNIETKRKLQKKCIKAPRFLRETLEVFYNAKQNLIWNNRMVQNREGCAIQLDTFADMIKNTTKELDASIVQDDRMEQRIRMRLKKYGIKVMKTIFLITKEGYYEIHITAKCIRGICVTTAEMICALSEVTGRKMILEKNERTMIGQAYCTIVCLESAKFHTLQGVAKIGKGGEKISGDSFLMMELPGGQKGVALSDGMGSGETAFRESAMVMEMLEELLASGFPKETAIQMMNTALVMGREEIRFSTIDMSVFDLYSGQIELLKVGASTTFIKSKGEVERIASASLPIGVLSKIDIEIKKRQLESGDMVVMVTDGVLDALPVGEQEFLLETIIKGSNMNNPKEMAHHILEQVLEWDGKEPQDDMTVLVVGIWNC